MYFKVNIAFTFIVKITIISGVQTQVEACESFQIYKRAFLCVFKQDTFILNNTSHDHNKSATEGKRGAYYFRENKLEKNDLEILELQCHIYDIKNFQFKFPQNIQDV